MDKNNKSTDKNNSSNSTLPAVTPELQANMIKLMENPEFVKAIGEKMNAVNNPDCKPYDIFSLVSSLSQDEKLMSVAKDALHPIK